MEEKTRPSTSYAHYVDHLQRLADIHAAIALMAWDKEVYMPKRGASFRTRQLMTIEGLAHAHFTDKAFIERVLQLQRHAHLLDTAQRCNVQRTAYDLERARKLDRSFVEHKSQITSQAFHAWLDARAANDYGRFAPALQQLVDLKREEAERLGYEAHPYDALLEGFEPGARVAQLDALFGALTDWLRPFATQLRRRTQVADDFLHQFFPAEQQWAFGLRLLQNMGYDFDAGRQDKSTHPFTISFSPGDVRVTTRIDEHDFACMTWSTIHEGGHALYEQGLPPQQYGLPLGQPASLAIHESQSRLWENHVGRSLSWWQYHYPALQTSFPEQLGSISLETFWKGINKVAPGFIRTEADELHYHLHIVIRYEIEKGLIEGSCSTDQLETIWNEKYHTHLGITPPDALQGILQDIHWAHGSFGYFPTYTLGSLYAAQFYAQAQSEIDGLESLLAQGQCGPLLSWLRKRIHRHGRRWLADDLCRRVTGKPLQIDAFRQYAEAKFAAVYADD